ncbi:DUF4124 domain-containing protein [Massilia sp. Se16.2.3]|uniref:DUF4124 domain-containing protein n=1 Tax=Massilia sp. Se16.2.3 TaxID=2709303 RepID=UPI0016047F11|nr:DUF4124 domain-containing protein [Massilia sp. Se16.2.3]QNA99810.1 DUF4124 domain-containing protein [Massilia sp. Se16.2.3]
MHPRSIAALLLLLLAHAASAEIYKVIGPGGRVSYTDQPPSVTTPNVQLFKHGRGRPAAGDEGADAARRANAPLLPTVRNVLNNNALALEGLHLCMQVLPASMRRYGDTLDGWKSRNREVTERAEQVLAASVTHDARAQIRNGAINDARQLLQQVRTATPARQSAWCEATAGEIGGGGMDLAKQPGVGRLLQSN